MSAKAKRFRRYFGNPSFPGWSFEPQNLRVAKLIIQYAEPNDTGLAAEWARRIIEQHDGGNDHGTEQHVHVPALPDPAITRR